MRKAKRLFVAAALAVSAFAIPFAAGSAQASCIDTGIGNGCSPCPKPIVVNGKTIITFYCVE